jgi:hypothetical protein
MFAAVLVFLFAGNVDPIVFKRPETEPPFVGIAACEEWKAQESERIARVIASLSKNNQPDDWMISCVPVGPLPREG